MLLVTQDVHVRTVVNHLARRRGYAVTLRESCTRAQSSPRRRWDIALLDLATHGDEGLSWIAEIGARAGRPKVVVIDRITDEAGRDRLAQGMVAGADDFLAKPVIGNEAAAALDRLGFKP